MNSRQLKALVRSMREQGVTHLKTKDLEISLDQSAPKPVEQAVAPERVILPQAPEASGPLAAAEENMVRTRIEHVKSIMATSDDELADQLFPVGKIDPTIEDYPEID